MNDAAYARELPFGAALIAEDRTLFRLFAPAQSRISLEIKGAAPQDMERRDDGWFELEAECGAGTAYRYRLETGQAVPDPASRAQESDPHGWSLVVDPNQYKWRNADWRGRPWRETILYELHCGLLGGFSGVASALPRLKELGITAVELMPIADFSGCRNWGYDGVLPFAPDRAYGSVEELKKLIDSAHELGLMMFLDVVYNHFGPDGNYIAQYAPEMFRDDYHTPWGSGIDFRRAEVRRFFIENALYWLIEFRFDGLRFDAVHAISEEDWLEEMAVEIRATIEPGRHVHLVLEHDGNIARLLRGKFDAQWNDDLHHVVHVLLTGEHEGYYVDYRDGARKLAKGLAEGFVYQGEPSAYRDGAPRGTPSADLPPTAFVFFLQNHDQIGNRALGERLTALADTAALEAAIALQMLAPQIPLLFMGEEDASRTPFLFFTDYRGELARAVREGRQREFARFKAFADRERQEQIPDPNSLATFEGSRPVPDRSQASSRFSLYRRLLALRHAEIAPRLEGAHSLWAKALGEAAVTAKWRMGDGAVLSLSTNLGSLPAQIDPPSGRVLFESRKGAAALALTGTLPGHATIAFLEIAT
ncbi:MAG TPA: malto-oligosyltrehalose trehalohydrolase [Methylovirgula sp.]|nr:malto-oligosyltrehalose trehalohydrolase [Methylovirgula sp.]